MLILTRQIIVMQVAFCRTGGAYTKMRRENPEMPDPLPDLQRELLASLKTSDEYTPLELQCDIFMILAKGAQAPVSQPCERCAHFGLSELCCGSEKIHMRALLTVSGACEKPGSVKI